MKRFFQICVAIATATPVLLSGFTATATVLPPVTDRAAALQPPAVPVSLDSTDFFDMELSRDRSIRAREDFLLTNNCLQNGSDSLETGIVLICQPRTLIPNGDVGGPTLELNDLPDREGLKLDLVLTRHRLEAGPSEGFGVRFRL